MFGPWKDTSGLWTLVLSEQVESPRVRGERRRACERIVRWSSWSNIERQREEEILVWLLSGLLNL